MIGLNLFKRAHSVAELTGALEAFDRETDALQGRQAELGGLLENQLALEAVGEGEPKGLKDLQRETAEISGKLAGRVGARRKIAQELQLAEAAAARAARAEKVKAARTWQKEAVAAADELISAMGKFSEAIIALQKVDRRMPGAVDELRPSVAPPFQGFAASFLRSMDRGALWDYRVDPERFVDAMGSLEGSKRILDYTLGQIEAGASSLRDRRAAGLAG
jgi:hypothetical protein